VLYDYAAADYYLFRFNLRDLDGRRAEAAGSGGVARPQRLKGEREREEGNLGKDVCEELTSNFRKSREILLEETGRARFRVDRAVSI